MSGHGPLCSQCGNSQWERVSDTEIRCSECGLGANVARLATAPRNASESGSSSPELEEILRLRQAGPRAAFARAAFRPFGLDDRWRGLRWFGGAGSSKDLVYRLELAHGDAPWDPASQQVRVLTLVPSHIGLDGTRQTIAAARALLAQEQAQSFWHHTGQLPAEVRRAAFPLDAGVVDPTAPWADRELTIDAAAVTFRVLLVGDFWVGQAQHGDVMVGIESRGWPPDTTGLVTVDELDPYETGSQEIQARFPRPS
jgi:hypothetical protein